MKSALKNTIIVLAIVLVPFLLGVLLVGPAPPTGRNTESTTRIGHKAYLYLLEALGYRVRRFERGVETLPAGRGVLIALEPGPSLFRDGGRYARGLSRWIEGGSAALITLGPDPDHAAETDDRDQLFGDTAKRAIELARRLERRARERAKDGEDEDERPGGESGDRDQRGSDTRRDANRDRDRDGNRDDGNRDDGNRDDGNRDDGNRDGDRAPGDPAGGDDDGASIFQREESTQTWEIDELANFLELAIVDARITGAKLDTPIALRGPLAAELGPNAALFLTRPRTFRFLDPARAAERATVLLEAEGEAVLVELALGAGKILLLSEPRLLQNGALGRGAHARLGAYAIDRLAAHAGSKDVYFEEFSHGGREAANIIELVAVTRARWPVLQLALASLIWIFAIAGRRRSPVPTEVPPRRSRHEVIDAMASLFLRSGDTRGAFERLLLLSRLRIARSLGITGERASSERELARAIELRAGLPASEVDACLQAGGVTSGRQLVERARKLRDLRTKIDANR